MKRKLSNEATQDDGCNRLRVIVVSCGEPKKGMGWFHLTQLLDNPLCQVVGVVEPFFLGPGKCAPGSQEFMGFRQAHPSVHFCQAIQDVPITDVQDPGGCSRRPLLVLIAARTCDAPKLFTEALDKGATHIYLEKPGAETAAQLRSMAQEASRRDVPVVLGYNKNVSSYVLDALAALEKARSEKRQLQVTLEHNNAFTPGAELMSFITGPGAEGMIHNMCCHELALAITLFGIDPARILRVVLDPKASKIVDIGNGKSDWQRVSFCIVQRVDQSENMRPVLPELRIDADRCGGNFSQVRLRQENALEGSDEDAETVFRLPTTEHRQWIEQAQAADPDIRPYFLLQSPDYRQLKNVFLQHVVAGHKGVPPGVVGLAEGVKVLELADLLSGALKECWASGSPWTWSNPTQ